MSSAVCMARTRSVSLSASGSGSITKKFICFVELAPVCLPSSWFGLGFGLRLGLGLGL